MSKIDKLLEIMSLLRDKEKGCPWDVEQTYDTIVPHTLEEAYEVADAVARKDMAGLKEELGDLLLQVVFYAQMASEEKRFAFDDVVGAICDKLVSRHPHVFGDAIIKTADEQTEAWDKMKHDEKKQKRQDVSVLDGVIIALPALVRAHKLQKRAAKVGFDWPNIEQVFAKLEEELGELKAAIKSKNADHISEEMGDTLFVLANIARHLNLDPEASLRETNSKFERRFHYIERALNAEQREFADTSLQELDELWDQAKLAEKTDTAA